MTSLATWRCNPQILTNHWTIDTDLTKLITDNRYRSLNSSLIINHITKNITNNQYDH